MKIEITNAHFSALETKDLLKENNIAYTYEKDCGELNASHDKITIIINSLNDLLALQEAIANDIIISDYVANDGTTQKFLLIYDDYLE